MNPASDETAKELVILVDETDRQIGTEEKLTVHRDGTLHRAFSVLLFNSRDELLLQRRALGKYHSGGLWSNTCCSHPRPAEDVEAAAIRRLREEMGIECKLWKAFDFVYRAEVDELIEHEFDHVFLGKYDGLVSPDPVEVMSHRWLTVSAVQQDLKISPGKYTPWLKMVLDGVIAQGLA